MAQSARTATRRGIWGRKVPWHLPAHSAGRLAQGMKFPTDMLHDWASENRIDVGACFRRPLLPPTSPPLFGFQHEAHGGEVGYIFRFLFFTITVYLRDGDKCRENLTADVQFNLVLAGEYHEISSLPTQECSADSTRTPCTK